MGAARQVVDRYWAAFEAGDFERVREVFGPESDLVGAGFRVRGADEIIGVLRAYKRALPDLRHNETSYVESGDTIAVELRVTGTMSGPLASPKGEVPPTGKRLDLASCDYITVKDGKIRSWRAYWDNMDFLGQLGLLPQPATA